MFKYLEWILKGSKKQRILRYSLIFSLILASVNTIYYAARPAIGRFLFAQQFKPSKQPSQAKILVAYIYGIGENETAERIRIAGRNLKPIIDVHILCMLKNAPNGGMIINNGLKFNDKVDPVELAIKKFKPDILLALQPIKYHAGVANYLTLTLGLDKFINYDPQHGLQLLRSEILRFDTILSGFQDLSELNTIFARNNKKLLHMPWYVTSYITDYAPATPKKLFYSGADVWDEWRSNKKFKEMFSLLDKTGYLMVCGLQEKWQHTPNSYIGFIPADGKSIINTTHEAGVALILHSKTHLKSGIPTARIFEATSANAIIISDKHPFVMKNFGENVLYIDIEQDAEDIFRQITEHMQWILNNPQEAQRKAAKCNEIYKQNFSLEQQLLKLVEMHKRTFAAS